MLLSKIVRPIIYHFFFIFGYSTTINFSMLIFRTARTGIYQKGIMTGTITIKTKLITQTIIIMIEIMINQTQVLLITTGSKIGRTNIPTETTKTG